MYLNKIEMNHQEEEIHKSLLVDDDTYIRCRERIFYSAILGDLLCTELYNDRENAPRELTTFSGDLERTLKMITDSKEYEITLMFFTEYRSMARGAVNEYRNSKNKSQENNEENILKDEITSLIRKVIEKKRKKDGDIHAISLDDMFIRINTVKQSNKSFERYMHLMGFKSEKFDEIDEIIKRCL